MHVKDLLTPLVIHIKYAEKCDMQVMYSRKTRKPCQEDCEEYIQTPNRVIIHAIKKKHVFVKDTVYFKFAT